MTDLVRLEVADGIGVIRLDRPLMNALNAEIQQGLIEVCREAATRRDVSAVIVYGGDKVFAAGADIKEMEAMSYTDMVDHSTLLQDFTKALSGIPKPTVAAITGYALGGGCEVALACDFRVAAAGAKLGQPEILLGIIPGAGGTQRLARLVGSAKAKDIIFSGRFVDAAEALAIGLVDDVVDVVEPGDVLEAAKARVRPFVGGPAYAMRAAKEAIDRGLEVDLNTGLEIERTLFAGLFATKDQATGMRSFVESGLRQHAHLGQPQGGLRGRLTLRPYIRPFGRCGASLVLGRVRSKGRLPHVTRTREAARGAAARWARSGSRAPTVNVPGCRTRSFGGRRQCRTSAPRR